MSARGCLRDSGVAAPRRSASLKVGSFSPIIGFSRSHCFVGGREQLVGLRRRAQKCLNCLKILLGPALAEDIADHGDLALGAELAHHVLDPDQLGEAFGLEPRRIGPEIENGIELALLRPFGQERRRAVFLRGLCSQVEIGGPQRIGHEQEPALVERASGHAEPLALEIAERLDRRVGWHHDGAERGGERREGEVAAAAPLARDPQPVRGDDVDRAALQAHRGRLGARQRHDIEIDAFGLVETVGTDGVEHPADGAEFQNADRDLVRGIRGLRKRKAREGAEHQS